MLIIQVEVMNLVVNIREHDAVQFSRLDSFIDHTFSSWKKIILTF